LELNYEVEDINNKETWPPFIMDIYDQDYEFMTEEVDYIGRCVVEPEDMVEVEMKDNEGHLNKFMQPTVIDT
jgi:hypothetical protein